MLSFPKKEMQLISQFDMSVMSDSLWPLGLQHPRLPCPSSIPGACSNSCPLSQWCHPINSSSVIPFSCLQSFPASGSFPVSQFFASGGQSIGVSASVSVLPMNIQDWFPWGWTVRVQLQQPGNHPEGMSGVGKEWFSLWLEVRDYMFISSIRSSLTKALGQRFDIFSPPSPWFIVSLLPFKQSSCFSDSLRIVFTWDYIVTHAYVWTAYHIPQFLSYLSKSCLPLVS